MEIRFLEFDGETLQFADYLDRVDPDCGELIMQRLELLTAFSAGDRLPDPPVSPLLGIPGLFQLQVDYDGEVHRVALGAHLDCWLIVFAFRCDVDPIPASDAASIRAAWASRA